jgi:SPP1 family predicted phage head-tail adaptor
MKCQSIKKNNKKICISDFDKKIKIQIYSLQVSNVAETQIGFIDLAEVWAFVKTRNNASFVANVNIDTAITIEFYIRYIDNIDLNNQIFIEYEGKRFKINSIENIDKDNEVIVFRAIERGKQELDANRI